MTTRDLFLTTTPSKPSKPPAIIWPSSAPTSLRGNHNVREHHACLVICLSQRPKNFSIRWPETGHPEAKPQSRATARSRRSGVTIDGGEIGGNTALSADAVFMHLAPRGRRLDLARWGYGFAARFHRGSMRNVALKSLCKVGS